jgi:ABC-type phosphate transport system permease subunit
MLVAVPIGLLTAIYISEISSAGQERYEPLVEMLGGFPSVVLGS